MTPSPSAANGAGSLGLSRVPLLLRPSPPPFSELSAGARYRSKSPNAASRTRALTAVWPAGRIRSERQSIAAITRVLGVGTSSVARAVSTQHPLAQASPRGRERTQSSAPEGARRPNASRAVRGAASLPKSVRVATLTRTRRPPNCQFCQTLRLPLSRPANTQTKGFASAHTNTDPSCSASFSSLTDRIDGKEARLPRQRLRYRRFALLSTQLRGERSQDDGRA